MSKISLTVVKNQLLHPNKIVISIYLTIFSIFIIISIATLPFLNRIYPNIYIGNVYLGDKPKDKAIEILKSQFFVPDKLKLEVLSKKSEILTSEIIYSIDYQQSIERAYNFSNTGNFFLDTITKIKLIFYPINLNAIIKINEDKLLETILIASESIERKPVLPSAKKINEQIIIDRGKDGIEIDIEKARQDIGRSLTSGYSKEIKVETKIVKSEITEIEALKFKENAEKLIGKSIELKSDFDSIIIEDEELISFLTIDGFSDALIKNKILQISRSLNRNPQDSVFIIENGKVQEFTPSMDGIIVNEDLLLTEIKNVPSEINIPVIKVAPKIKNGDINNLGIDTLIGKGSSIFKGSIPNRIHNVNLAQSKFKGLLIPPNEIVSFNEVLGDVSGLTGYKAAYVIMDGKTVLGDGGGVCQVSTTLFRAVLNAGLPIIERRAHAYRVGYYEQGSSVGLDATVYSPTTDFKFKNDTAHYLLIQPTIDLNNLTLKFDIYGTNDGRVSTVSKPIITSSIAPGEDLYIDDSSLPSGVVKQIEHRAYGAKVVFDYKVTRNGEELINQKFISNYRPWKAVYLRGTGL